MNNVSFICSWGQSNQDLIKRYQIMAPNSKPEWKNVKAVATNPLYYVALDLPHFNGLHTIHLRREPNIIKGWPPLVSGDNVYDYSSSQKFHACTWWLGKSYDELSSLKYTPKKVKSIICSDKYKWRHDYVKSIILNNENTIGMGNAVTNKYSSHADRTELLLSSSVSVCIENCSQANYFTEKITDALLAWCMPLYWGCPNIGDFLPEGSYRLIDINNADSVTELMNRPISPFEIDAMDKARNLILNKYNIWECIYSIINERNPHNRGRSGS